MIKRSLLLITVFTLVAGFSLLWHMPASWLVEQVKLPAQLKVKQVKGTIWQGSAEQLQWQQWLIQPLSWQAKILPLLQQQLQLEVEGYFYDGPFNAHILAQQQQIDISQAHYKNNIGNLSQPLARGMIDLGGKIQIHIKQAQLKNNKVSQLRAQSQWQQASIIAPFKLQLGKITIKTKLVDEKIVNNIKGIAGDMDIEGTIMITQNQDFSVRLKLHPNKKLPQEVTLSLKMIAQSKPNGDFVINRKGNLRYLRLM